MGDHFFLDVDRLRSSSAAQNSSQAFSRVSPQPAAHSIVDMFPQQSPPRAVSLNAFVSTSSFEAVDLGESAIAECRICQEEEDVAKLENPCACSGSVKYAHRKCVQRWCNEKGDTTCEICQQVFKGGYTAPPAAQPLSGDVAIDFSDDYTIELNDPRFLAMAAAQRRFLDAEYEEANSSSAACCRSAALILMALLLLRHAIAMVAASAEEDASMFFTLFLLRAAGFLLPCYIMARAMNILQSRRHRQEAAMAAAEVAIFLQQTGQARGMHVSLAQGQSQPNRLVTP